MPYQQIDPSLFDWGGQFQAGQDRVQRNALLEQELERRNAMFDLEQQQYADVRSDRDFQRGRVERADVSAASQEKLKQGLAQAEWVLQPGVTKQMVEQIIPELAQNYEKMNGPGTWAMADDDAVKQSAMEARIKLSSALGLGPPKAEDVASNIGKYNPGDYTPQSFAQFLQSGNPATLQRAWAPPTVSVQNVGQVPTIVDPGNRLGGGLTTPLSDPQAELNAAAAMKAAEAGAAAQAQATVEQGTKGGERGAALGMWETALGGLRKGLAASNTGPIVGRIPAITAGQQISQSSVSAIAPILKQIFRVAGEGVFTDRDQQILLEMIPDRKIDESAREVIISNIDAIVRAKLQGPSSSASQQTSGNRIRYDAKGNRIP